MKTFQEFMEADNARKFGRLDRDILSDKDNVVAGKGEEIEVVREKGDETLIRKVNGGEEVWVDSSALQGNVHWDAVGSEGIHDDPGKKDA